MIDPYTVGKAEPWAVSKSAKENGRKAPACDHLHQSRLRDLNPGPQLYESCALPLS
jgi:hypothetical protein